MKEEEILRCQIQEWYPRFQKVSIKTVVHPLPENFVDFLLDEGSLFLPKTDPAEDAFPNRIKITYPELQAEDYSTWTEEEDDGLLSEEAPSFPELENQVRDSIKSLGGSVFPKLNWSAPKDTAWISSNGTLKCSSFSDIVLLLKASDSLVHDLCHAFDSCEDKSYERPPQFFLALRKWYDLRPEMEFRVFVKRNFVVGISQREITGFYPVLVERKVEIERLILQFFVEHIRGKFGSSDFAFDCYVTKDGRVKLLDFSPWRSFTLPLLFSWDELENNHEAALDNIKEIRGSSAECLDESFSSISLGFGNGADWNRELSDSGHRLDFKIVESEGGVQPSLRASSGVPYDYFDMSKGSAWDEFLRRTDEEIKKQATDPAADG